MKGRLALMVLIPVLFIAFIMSDVHAQTVKAYMGLSPENNVKVVEFVKAKTGIQILQTFQSFGEIEAKVKSEAPNFNADMIIGCGSPLAFMAKKNGWADPYISPAWKGAQHVYVDPQGSWYNVAHFSFVLVGNKDRLKKAGSSMPPSWKDL